MGKKEKTVRKVVLDTIVLISSILFKGELAGIVDLWKRGKIVPVVSGETFDEFRKVLEYPKFRLTNGEIKTIIEEEVLPFFEIVDITAEVSGICKDPDDDKFLACALSASADLIVSGDKDLCDIAKYKSVKIVRASELLKMVD
ncbi:MAG: putative toxin-antitoxin system toxin component, PIN family [Nitrospirae bacterium]|nr:putative toxin-antitoxin system toxin component, PIN family [Nitrospirota bacterium]